MFLFQVSNLPYLETDQDVLDKFVMSMLLTCDGDMDMYGVCKDCRPGFEGSRYCYGSNGLSMLMLLVTVPRVIK